MENKEKIFRRIKGDLSKMDDKTFLEQPGFYDLIRSQVTAILKKNETVVVEFESTDSNVTAYTDGYRIHCNTWSPLVLNCENRYMKYLSNIGSASHECGHILYTDFDVLNNVRNKISKCTFDFKYSKELNAKSSYIKKYFIKEMMDLINIVEDAYIENCLCLEYPKEGILIQGLIAGNYEKFKYSPNLDEIEMNISMEMILSLYVGMIQIKECLGFKPKNFDKCSGPMHEKLVKALDKSAPLVKEYINSSSIVVHTRVIRELLEISYELLPTDEEFDSLINQLAQQLPQQNSSNNDESENNSSNQDGNSGDNNSSNKNESNKNPSSSGKGEDKTSEDSNDSENGSNSEDKQSEQNQNSADQNSLNKSNSDENSTDSKNGENASESSQDNSSSNSDGNGLNKDELLRKLIDEAIKTSEKLKKQTGVSDEAKGNGRSKRKIKGDSDNEGKHSNQETMPDFADQSDKLEKMIAEAIADEMISETSNDEFSVLVERANQYFPRSSYKIDGIQKIRFGNLAYFKSDYDKYYKNIVNVSKSCQRKIKQILKKRETDEFDTGHIMGPFFNVKDIYHKDGKYFSRENIPSDMPDVAFSILIDNSGSMLGRRIEKAKEAGILFQDLCEGLNIPVRVCSHTTGNYKVKLYNLVNFSGSILEKYAISQIEAENGNIDTMAVTALAEELLSRKEESKVLVVISDGAPCGTGSSSNNFHGVQYKKLNCTHSDKDMQELNACVRYWRKKGIKIIGVAIDDLELIKGIYEEGTLDCTDLNKLPTELLKIFKKYVLK